MVVAGQSLGRQFDFVFGDSSVVTCNFDLPLALCRQLSLVRRGSFVAAVTEHEHIADAATTTVCASGLEGLECERPRRLFEKW
jgi:hypothetical protein